MVFSELCHLFLVSVTSLIFHCLGSLLVIINFFILRLSLSAFLYFLCLYLHLSLSVFLYFYCLHSSLVVVFILIFSSSPFFSYIVFMLYLRTKTSSTLFIWLERLQKLLDDDGIPDGEWEETIDEPEMEFDELTMDLGTAQIRGALSACDMTSCQCVFQQFFSFIQNYSFNSLP